VTAAAVLPEYGSSVPFWPSACVPNSEVCMYRRYIQQEERTISEQAILDVKIDGEFVISTRK